MGVILRVAKCLVQLGYLGSDATVSRVLEAHDDGCAIGAVIRSIAGDSVAREPNVRSRNEQYAAE